MIIEQTLKTVVAGAAVAAAVIVSVVAAAFTVYALVVNQIGPAGGAAVVAGLFALIAGGVALFATQRAAPRRREEPAGLDLRALGLDGLDLNGANLVERASEIIKERPVVAAGAAIAFGLIAYRNPELVTMLARSILSPGRADDDGDRPRR